jgi:hypothetical protein
VQDVEQGSENWPEDVQKTIDEDPAQLELALLVSKAPIIKSLTVRDNLGRIDVDEKEAYDESPVWLLPIISAIQEVMTERYQNLHTIDVDLQWRYAWEAAHLL